MTSPTTRRAVLLGAATLPLAAPALLTARAALAAAPLQGPASATFHRFTLGKFEVTSLLAGAMVMESPQQIFGTNASPEEFNALAKANFLPSQKAINSFTPTLVNTGEALVLFDTGLSAEGITLTLKGAGYSPDQIDLVVLTHMHGDHTGGLSGAAGPTFANALYAAGAAEFDFWASASNESFDQKVKPLAEKMTMLEAGGRVAPGITARAAFGHSPGHMAFMIESEGQTLALIGDVCNHYVWSLQRPDWEVLYDMDKAQAATTRKALLGEIAQDRLPFIGYHMPFPALAYLEAREAGFGYVPASYQFSL